jgi:hypothetical protein
MSLRQLDFEDVKKLLIDPWHVLVVDSLCDTTLICTYGQHVYDIIEEVDVDNDATEKLSNLADENVIFYDAFNVKEVKGIMACPHFFELWREDAYGPQPDEAYEKATSLGLAGNPRD